MPSKPRSQVVDPSEVGVYHCWNRLVRSLWLWGLEWLTGVDYSYRKRWMYQRLRQLAADADQVVPHVLVDPDRADAKPWVPITSFRLRVRSRARCATLLARRGSRTRVFCR